MPPTKGGSSRGSSLSSLVQFMVVTDWEQTDNGKQYGGEDQIVEIWLQEQARGGL